MTLFHLSVAIILVKILCIKYQGKTQSLNIRKGKMLVFCFLIVGYIILINKQGVHFSNSKIVLNFGVTPVVFFVIASSWRIILV